MYSVGKLQLSAFPTCLTHDAAVCLLSFITKLVKVVIGPTRIEDVNANFSRKIYIFFFNFHEIVPF